MDLSDRRRGKSMLVKVREHVAQRCAQLLAQQLLEPRERHRRDAVAERREFLLKLIPLIFRQAIQLDHRDHLANLHRCAAHPAKLLDEFVYERGSAFLLGGSRPLRRTNPIRGAHPSPSHALSGHETSDACRPRDPARR